MSAYRRRLERDLDGWISSGLIPAGSRETILESVAESKRIDAATALGVIGAVLAGVAVVAFVAANWGAIPRGLRFGMILAAFLAAAGGAAWTKRSGREITSQALLCVAALVFAAAIGLTGQIFDIAGDPQAAARGAGLAAILLALAGASAWPATIGLAFLMLGDFASPGGPGGAFGWLPVAAPLAVIAALTLRSTPLAHAAALGVIVAPLTISLEGSRGLETLALAATLVLGASFVGVRALRDRLGAASRILQGWLAFGALGWMAPLGAAGNLDLVVHSILWLAASAGVVVLGRRDRHSSVTAAGVLGMLGAGGSLMANLGVDLLVAALVFGLGALVSLAIAFALRRGRAP